MVGASVIARDITRQKRAEEALRQSEERFRVALKSAPVVVFNQDRELRYTWINSPVLAWAEHDWMGRTDAEIVGGEEGARLTAIKQEVLRSGQGTRAETAGNLSGRDTLFRSRRGTAPRCLTGLSWVLRAPPRTLLPPRKSCWNGRV